MVLLNSIKSVVKRGMDASPTFEMIVRKSYGKYRLYRFRIKARINTREEGPDPYRIVWVKTDRIEKTGPPDSAPFDPWEDMGRIEAGNWDKIGKKFEDLDVFRSFKLHFEEGENWEDTPWFKRVAANLSQDSSNRGCETVEEWKNRLLDVDKLYESIKENGYKTQEELIEEGETTSLDMSVDDNQRIHDEITINIGRDGELLFNNGRHRLSIAKILNLDKVPVRVLVRHQKWWNFRNELEQYINQEMGGKSYNKLLHPDLKHVPYSHESDARFELIKSGLKSSRGELLDIGANLGGYFCHRFEDLGYDCYAVEHIPARAYFLRQIRDANGYSFEVIEKSIFDYNVVNKEFSVVIALNIFHHFLKEEGTYRQFLSLIDNLSANEMVFQSHSPGEQQMEDAYKQVAKDEFCELIIKNSKFNEYENIGVPEDDNRPIYILRQ